MADVAQDKADEHEKKTDQWEWCGRADHFCTHTECRAEKNYININAWCTEWPAIELTEKE